jgi:hypothetical protein
MSYHCTIYIYKSAVKFNVAFVTPRFLAIQSFLAAPHFLAVAKNHPKELPTLFASS